MVIRAVLLAAVILMAVTQQVSAQMVMGAGTISCGEWLRFRSFENRPGNVTQRNSAGT
jgi:hypothetical protein